MTSGCGSADVLEALGAKIDLTPEQVAAVHREDRLRLHVRAGLPPGDEVRRPPPAARSASAPCSTSSARSPTRRTRSRQLLGVARPELAPLMAAALETPGQPSRARRPRPRRLRRADARRPLPRLRDERRRDHSEYTLSRRRARPADDAPAARDPGGTPEQNAAILTAVLDRREGPLPRRRAAQRRRRAGRGGHRAGPDGRRSRRPPNRSTPAPRQRA